MLKVILSLLLILPLQASAQRAFKPVRTALKAKNYKEAVNQVNKLRQDSTYKYNTDLCLLSMEAQKGLNDAENTKLYLKQAYDTVAFFSTTRLIVQEAVRVDSIERVEHGEQGMKTKQSRHAANYLKDYFSNLHPAARFFFRRGSFAEACDYLRLCIDLPRTELGQRLSLPARNEAQNASLYLTAAFNLKKYDDVHRYETEALLDTASLPVLVECLAYTAEAEQDTARYRYWLDEGLHRFPQQTQFFTRLADYYTARQDYASVLRIADDVLQRDSTYLSARLAQCMASLNMKRFDDCILAGEKLLQADTANVEAHYYMGASYVSKAVGVKLPDNALTKGYTQALNQQKAYYRKAEYSLERYRSLTPNLQKRWAPLLYKVYLALNEGKKFAEIENMLQWLSM